jgi:hypothetical protein
MPPEMAMQHLNIGPEDFAKLAKGWRGIVPV